MPNRLRRDESVRRVHCLYSQKQNKRANAADDVCQTAGFLKKPATAEVAQPLRDPDVISVSIRRNVPAAVSPSINIAVLRQGGLLPG